MDGQRNGGSGMDGQWQIIIIICIYAIIIIMACNSCKIIMVKTWIIDIYIIIYVYRSGDEHSV